MTTNSPKQPHRPQQNAYNPITLDDLQKPSPSTPDLFASLLNPAPRWAAVPFFGFLCFYTQRMPFLAPLMILILLSCLLARLEDQPRKIAAVPLALSAIKLSFGLASESVHAFSAHTTSSGPDDACFLWLPIFFSACLVLIPDRASATFKIVLAGSCVLLASGLLPGLAFIAIFYMLDYLLFIAIIIAIFVDLAAYWPTRARNLSAAH